MSPASTFARIVTHHRSALYTGVALMVHAGETVRPAMVNRDWGGRDGGDSFTLNVTTPTQVLDPVDVNRQLAFLRKTTGR